jgi:restriction system protein
MAKGKAEFTQWMGPLLKALKILGGSGSPKDVIKEIIKQENISEEKLNEKTKTGIPRIKNQIYWARQYLVWEELLASTKKGIWKLSKSGENTELDRESAQQIFKKWIEIHAKRRKEKKNQEINDEDDIGIDDTSSLSTNYRQEIISILRGLHPSDFEKFCLLLLRENDFEELRLSGGSKDDGIDGFGILRVNPFVSFRVLFQCKRYKEDNKVKRTQIADFRNAMLGRADKGIFITTSTFTNDAENEASRDGAPPIELVDFEQLLNMIEKSELGLNPVTTYEIDYDFFKQYSKTE